MKEVIERIDKTIEEKKVEYINNDYIQIDDLLYHHYEKDQWFELVQVFGNMIINTFYCQINSMGSCCGDSIDSLDLHIPMFIKPDGNPLFDKKSWRLKPILPEEVK